MKKYIALIALLALSFNANSATIQDYQDQTSDGQEFTHNLTGPVSDGTGGILTVRVRGDFDSSVSGHSEHYDLAIDGNLLGTNLRHTTAGAYNIFNINNSFNDYEFSLDFAISSALMTSIMSDLLAVVTVDFGDNVRYGLGSVPVSFSEVTLAYNNSVSAVPVPAALFMFAPALLGFLGLRRKTKA